MSGASIEPALSGVRVIEYGRGVALAYAGRLLTDCGADVTKVDMFGQGPASEVDEALFAYLDGDKSVVSPSRGGDSTTTLQRLLAKADILLTSLTARQWEEHGTTLGELAERYAGLTIVDVTSFGLSGPYRDFVGDPELVVSCLSGFAYGTPKGVGDPEANPPRPSGCLDVEIVGGVFAAIAALAGSLLAGSDQLGHLAEVAMFEAMAAFDRLNVAQYTYAGVIPSRSAQSVVLRAPTGFMRCSDGYVNIHCANDEQWRRLVAVMGSPDWASNELFTTGSSRAQFWDALGPLMADWFAQRPKLEVTSLLQANRIVCFPHQTMADLLADEQLRHRQWFRAVCDSIGRTVTVPGPAFHLEGMSSAMPLKAVRPAPSALTARGRPPGLALTGRATLDTHADLAPLSGVRVLDLSTVIGGPLAAQLLGQLGAEVIKVESREYPDLARQAGPYVPGHEGQDRSGYFHGFNAAKRSVVVEISTPQGRDLLERMMAQADVVLENFSAAAAKKLALEPQEVVSRHRHLVYLSQTGLGRDGPHGDYVTYGPQLMARAGWNTVLAAVDGSGAPMAGGGQLADQLAGAHEVLAVILALLQRERTGRGQYIDISMLECLVPAVVREMIRYGLGMPDAALRPEQYMHRCAGDDRWVGIQVKGEVDRTRLASVIGARLSLPSGAADAADLAKWLHSRTPDEAMIALQSQGIAAARVSNAADVAEDVQLRARNAIFTWNSPILGPLRLPAIPIVLDGRRGFSDRPAPNLGENTREVLLAVLGLSDTALTELERAGVI